MDLMHETAMAIQFKHPDEPIADFDKAVDNIGRVQSVTECRELNEWLERQDVCSIIVKHHGIDGLDRMLKAAARASVRNKAPLTARIRAVAGMLELL